MADALYVSGYNNTKMTLEALAARHAPKMLHEYARRLFALIEFSDGLVGIGNSWRSTETQAANYARDPKRFAPPGSSFHETQQFADGTLGCAAVDTVGVDGRHSEAWEFVRVNGLRFGLLQFGNVNREPWHTQCSDLDKGVRTWKNNGRHNPGIWTLPKELDIDFGFDDGINPDAQPETQPQPRPDLLGQTEKIVQQLPVLRVGDKGEHVQSMQGLLNARIEALRVAEDGDFGPQTQAALKSFQSSVGITPDGICGRGETWPALLLVS